MAGLVSWISHSIKERLSGGVEGASVGVTESEIGEGDAGFGGLGWVGVGVDCCIIVGGISAGKGGWSGLSFRGLAMGVSVALVGNAVGMRWIVGGSRWKSAWVGGGEGGCGVGSGICGVGSEENLAGFALL